MEGYHGIPVMTKQEDFVPRIPVHTIDSAPEGSRETLKTLAARMGKVLNIHGEMAHSPVVLAAYSGIAAAIAEHGTFDARTREAIALGVVRKAAANVGDVDDATWNAALQAGWTEDQLTEAFVHTGRDAGQSRDRLPGLPQPKRASIAR